MLKSLQIQNISKQLSEFWSNLDKPNKRRIIIISAILLLIIILTTVLLNKKEYVVLYSNLEPKDAGEIMTILNDMGVAAKTQGADTILIDKAHEDKVRMTLATEGYPKNGFNYDFFTDNIGFGTTDFEKQKYLQFQLQDRLQNTIKTLEGVQDAIVTISLPERDSFVLKDDRQPASASVLLVLEHGVDIAPNKVKGIEELMLKSVMGLRKENLSIVDSNMNVLNNLQTDEMSITNIQFELQRQVHERLKKQLTSMLEPIFGRGNVITEIYVELNFDEQVTETIQFEPVIDDEGIIVSINELIEQMQDTVEGGVPGQDANMGVSLYPELERGDGVFSRAESTINYEVNQIKEQIRKAQGQIKNISVSVILNSSENEISQGIMDGVQAVVAGSVGIDEEKVVVRNMEFADSSLLEDQMISVMQQRRLSERNKFIKDMILYGLGALIIAALLFLAYRVLVLKKEDVFLQTPEGLEFKLDEDRLDVKEQSRERRNIEKFIIEKPEEAAQLLRTWLVEE